MKRVLLFMIIVTSALTSCENRDHVWQRHDPSAYQQDLTVEERHGSMALLLTSFESFDEFQNVVEIDYLKEGRGVVLRHKSSGYSVESILKPGVDEDDLMAAVQGGLSDKVSVAFRSPYAVVVRNQLQCVEWLARHRPGIFGQADVAFYDLAEQMTRNLSTISRRNMSKRDLDEKGYTNTFNHVVAQAFMTSMFSEKLADFVADLHERKNMPELISGDFTPEQIADLEFGALDNYLDMINNEWGQEIGKYLSDQLEISPGQCWDFQLASDYLNGIQDFMSRAFGVSFTPFQPTDLIIVKLTGKLNMASGNCDFGIDKLYQAGCINCDI